MSPRTVAPPPTDKAMWRKLFARTHPDAGGSEDLFAWVDSLHEERLTELRQERGRVHEEALQVADKLVEVLGRDKAVHARMVREAQGISTRLLENTSRDHDGAALPRALAAKLPRHASAWLR